MGKRNCYDVANAGWFVEHVMFLFGVKFSEHGNGTEEAWWWVF